jgi:nucleotide-binding universal stress UspA family protein
MKIVLALDGINDGGELVYAVVSRPWPAGSKFCLLNVFDPYPFAKAPAFLDRAKMEVRRNLENAAGKLKQGGASAKVEITLGNPRRAISSFARDWQADLIMIGTNDLKGWERFVIGSTMKSVVRTAPCSVEVVRRPERDATERRALRILLATDGSMFSTAAAGSIATRPWPPDTEVKIVSVPEFLPLKDFHTLHVAEAEDLGLACVEEAKVCAHNAAAMLAGAGLKITEEVPMTEDRVSKVILKEAEHWNADLIVLGAHGRSGFDRLVMGSVSEAVALHAGCSVEIIRGGNPEEQK